MQHYPWAIVDVETTGLQVTRDEITEIAILVMTEQGIVRQWQRLIKPRRPIPHSVSALTGITNDMVSDAPYFEEVALELVDLLKGCVLVAHNARFDFGFIKNAFKRCDISYQTPILCTLKLLKQLFPSQRDYDLASISKALKILPQVHHRAAADVATLYEVIQQMIKLHGWPTVMAVAKTLYRESSIPSKLTTDVSKLPETPGVYIFYGDNNELPLYIGKSISLRQRVLSHFSGDYADAKEFKLSQQVVRVEVIKTAGELSALLLESTLIKKYMPLYNRRLRRKTTLAGFKLEEIDGYLTVSIARQDADDDYLIQPGMYGAFRSRTAAKNTLLELIKSHHLCPKLCSVEQGRGACFSYQLKRCRGACIHEEPSKEYNNRLLAAFKEYQTEVWPYQSAIAIKEHCKVHKITQFSVFYRWRYLGSVGCEKSLNEWRQLSCIERVLGGTHDDYKIVLSYLTHKIKEEQIIKLC